MTVKPIQDLMAEHGGIKLMLRVMAKVAEKLRRGETVDMAHWDKIIEFLQNFADRCHHGKEEGILFPRLSGNAAHARLLQELLNEHQRGRGLVRDVAEWRQKNEKQEAEAGRIAENMEEFIELLTSHIEKEDGVLFPAAEQELGEEEQEAIGEEFEKLEREVIGEGKHEEYHGWLKELKNIYLAPQ